MKYDDIILGEMLPEHWEEVAGFRKIGYREKIDQLEDIWKDNIQMERRSKKVGL